jgi:hypothetical protein
LAGPNGTYKVSTGQSLQLTEDRYPSIPKVLSVNGRPPQWINGELILNAGQPNRITWAKFKAYASFKQCAYETYELNCTDYGNLSSGGTITNASICPLIGLAGNNVTSITLGPTVLKHNVNYILTLQYSAITSATTQPVLSGAFYSSKVIVPIIAQQLKKVAPR